MEIPPLPLDKSPVRKCTDTARQMYICAFNYYRQTRTPWIQDVIDHPEAHDQPYWLLTKIDTQLAIERPDLEPRNTLTHKLMHQLCQLMIQDVIDAKQYLAQKQQTKQRKNKNYKKKASSRRH